MMLWWISGWYYDVWWILRWIITNVHDIQMHGLKNINKKNMWIMWIFFLGIRACTYVNWEKKRGESELREILNKLLNYKTMLSYSLKNSWLTVWRKKSIIAFTIGL